MEVVVDKQNLVLGNVTDFKKTLSAAKFVEVRRRAKLLTFVLEKDNHEIYLTAHLKMTGRFLLRNKGDPRDSYQHVWFVVGNKELRFCDLRQFGYLQLVSKPDLDEILEAYGPEPLDDLALEEFVRRLKRNMPIKPLLLDQKVFSGIGNIYANEALFKAKILPQRKAISLTNTEAAKLFTAVGEVLALGLKFKGTTNRDESFRDIYDKPGQNSQNLLVYEKNGGLCPNNCGEKIKKIMLGGRGTYFCSHCQV